MSQHSTTQHKDHVLPFEALELCLKARFLHTDPRIHYIKPTHISCMNMGANLAAAQRVGVATHRSHNGVELPSPRQCAMGRTLKQTSRFQTSSAAYRPDIAVPTQNDNY